MASITITSKGLSNSTQGLLMFLAIWLPFAIVWANAGLPLNGVLFTGFIADTFGALLAFVKEILGSAAPVVAK